MPPKKHALTHAKRALTPPPIAPPPTKRPRHQAPIAAPAPIAPAPPVFATIEGIRPNIIVHDPPPSLRQPKMRQHTPDVSEEDVPATHIITLLTEIKRELDSKLTEMDRKLDNLQKRHDEVFQLLQHVSLALDGSQGTLVWIEGWYYLLTCFHCVYKRSTRVVRDQVTLQFPPSILPLVVSVHLNPLIAKARTPEECADVVLVRLKNLPHGKRALVVSSTPPSVGDKVSGRGEAGAFAEVLVTKVATSAHGNFIETADFSQPGYSGTLACSYTGAFAVVQGYNDSDVIKTAAKIKNPEAKIRAIILAGKVHSRMVPVPDPSTLQCVSPPVAPPDMAATLKFNFPGWDGKSAAFWTATCARAL